MLNRNFQLWMASLSVSKTRRYIRSKEWWWPPKRHILEIEDRSISLKESQKLPKTCSSRHCLGVLHCPRTLQNWIRQEVRNECTTHRNSGKYSSSSSKLTSLSLRYLMWLTEYPLRSHWTFISNASGPPFVMIIVKSTIGRCSCPSNSSGLKSSGGPPRGWCRNSHLTCMSSDPLRRCRRNSNLPELSFSLKGLGGVLLYFCKHMHSEFFSKLSSIANVSQHKLLDIWSIEPMLVSSILPKP